MKRTWKGKLIDNVAVFTVEKAADYIVAEKGSGSFSQQTMVLTAIGRAASFRMGARAVEGTITAEQFAKYERWKTS